MKAKLVLKNGREIEVEVKAEDLKEIQLKKEKRTGYERINEYGGIYYTSDTNENNGYSEKTETLECSYAINAYKNADYYNDPTLAENNARADRLMRQLRRFAVENREKELDWNDVCQRRYYIFYDYETNKIHPGSEAVYRGFGKIYFDTVYTCRDAIDEFKDELIWYFTEYRDRV